jgi:hypothetical protein
MALLTFIQRHQRWHRRRHEPLQLGLIENYGLGRHSHAMRPLPAPTGSQYCAKGRGRSIRRPFDHARSSCNGSRRGRARSQGDRDREQFAKRHPYANRIVYPRRYPCAWLHILSIKNTPSSSKSVSKVVAC